MTTKDLENRFRKNIDGLIDYGDTIIVGTSGGPDSMLLAHLLYGIKDELNLHIILAHLNHLHRDEAIFDEKLVEDFAKSRDLDFKSKRASMDNFAKAHKISPEDAGRRLRYEFFNELASGFINAKIAVAHIMDDQAETVIMRMIRGTGLAGLSAMDYRSANIIRPILNFKKSEIIDYLDENNITYAIDQTNLSSNYTRNFIRNEIIPLMNEINPGAVENIFQMTELLREDEQIVNDNVLKIYNEIIRYENTGISFDRLEFEKLDKPYQTRLLIKAICDINDEFKDFSKENIDDFIRLTDLDTGKQITKDDLLFVKNYKTYTLSKISTGEEKNYSIYLNENDSISFGPYKISTKLVTSIDGKGRQIAYFDYDKLRFPLEVRNRRNGDKFRPKGFNHTKKLKDYFIDEKIDRNMRDRIPLIISNEEIIWIVGMRESSSCQIDKGTTNILKIEVTYDK